jgi:adenylylsulfate kinase
MSQEVKAGFALWLTGLPASGKSSLAQALRRLLLERVAVVQILDSDELRHKLTPQPTYSPAERDWFYEMIVFLAELLTRDGVHVLIAATAPCRAYREAARARIDHFVEVYVDCPPAVCRARDQKGLWLRADKGEITTLPGVGVPYEPPETPEVRVNTAHLSVEAAARQVMEQLERRRFFSVDRSGSQLFLPA